MSRRGLPLDRPFQGVRARSTAIPMHVAYLVLFPNVGHRGGQTKGFPLKKPRKPSARACNGSGVYPSIVFPSRVRTPWLAANETVLHLKRHPKHHSCNKFPPRRTIAIAFGIDRCKCARQSPIHLNLGLLAGKEISCQGNLRGVHLAERLGSALEWTTLLPPLHDFGRENARPPVVFCCRVLVEKRAVYSKNTTAIPNTHTVAIIA